MTGVSDFLKYAVGGGCEGAETGNDVEENGKDETKVRRNRGATKQRKPGIRFLVQVLDWVYKDEGRNIYDN